VEANEPRTIGELIRQAREDKGQSLRHAAEQLGVSDKIVKAWEWGFVKPDVDKIATIARYTGETRARVLVLRGVLTPDEGRALEALDAGATIPEVVGGDSPGYPGSPVRVLSFPPRRRPSLTVRNRALPVSHHSCTAASALAGAA
jgi:transcriptional regulator with XRE-family HTH domain